jgi:acetyl esterase/lipase
MMGRMTAIGIGLVSSLVLTTAFDVGVARAGSRSCHAEPAQDIAYASIEGVDPARLSLDVSPVAGACDAPVVVWVHGGGWRVGDRSIGADSRAEFYNGQGWMLVSVNYRLAVPGVEPSVGYPDFNEDIATALAWVRDEVAAYGGDAERAALVGHSAGAGIAAAVTADPGYLAPHGLSPDWIDCTVLLDTEGYDVAAMAVREEQLGAIYRNAFGDDPAVWADASPAHHIGEGPLPEHVLVVTRGAPSRTSAARTFGDQLRIAGSDVTVADVNPLSHSDVNRLIGSGDATMTPLMSETLRRCSATR